MSEETVCQRCGYVGPADAVYCAHCGGALVPPATRRASGIGGILGRLIPVHIGLLGLVLLVSISGLADHLMVAVLNFRWSLVLLALVLASGCATLGWQWNTPVPNDRRILHLLVVFAGMYMLLGMVWLVDRVWLNFLNAGGGKVVYAIPGVYVEASLEGRQLTIVDVPPYWLFVMIYTLVTAAVGNLVHSVQGRLGK